MDLLNYDKPQWVSNIHLAESTLLHEHLRDFVRVGLRYLELHPILSRSHYRGKDSTIFHLNYGLTYPDDLCHNLSRLPDGKILVTAQSPLLLVKPHYGGELYRDIALWLIHQGCTDPYTMLYPNLPTKIRFTTNTKLVTKEANGFYYKYDGFVNLTNLPLAVFEGIEYIVIKRNSVYIYANLLGAYRHRVMRLQDCLPLIHLLDISKGPIASEYTSDEKRDLLDWVDDFFESWCDDITFKQWLRKHHNVQLSTIDVNDIPLQYGLANEYHTAKQRKRAKALGLVDAQGNTTQRWIDYTDRFITEE